MPGPFYFAWSGGTIEEQQTVVTNGVTHGALVETMVIVGDIAQGSQQLVNLASAQGLNPGDLYFIAGPGIADGTFFVFDNSVLSGLPGSINLSNPAELTLSNANFTVTKSVPIAGASATFTGGNQVTLDGALLAPGIYGISGTGIGSTQLPVASVTGDLGTSVTTGNQILIVPTAFLEWDGSAGTMHIFAAWPTTTQTVFQGFPSSRTTYSVREQDVNATAAGTFAVLITGAPSPDFFLVDGIPSTVLASLSPGLAYNIAGSGIPPAATFIAPDRGATSVELDLPATASNLNAVLTITGPRTPNEPFDPEKHAVEDEEIVGLEISQEEGDFAILSATIKNPGIGLLAIGRKLWCWLSWDRGWLPDGTGQPDIVPLFNGELIGIPRRLANELVQLQFRARPDDYNFQKEALADQLKVLPYYDPVWIAANTGPDTVLEAYSRHWHTDRVTLQLSASDILQGEDGTITIDESQSIYDRFELNYGAPPLSSVEVSGTVEWTQEAEGFVDVTPELVRAFADEGSPYGGSAPVANVYPQFGSLNVIQALTNGGLISCLNGAGLQQDWPKPGTNIGGGWSLSTLNDSNGVPMCYMNDALQPYGIFQPQYFNVTVMGAAPGSATGTAALPTADQQNFAAVAGALGSYQYTFALSIYRMRMVLQFKASRRRTETVSAVVTADVQRVLSDPAENDRETISLSSQFVDKAVDPNGGVPIGNVAYRSYFKSSRGAQSFEYLLHAARAKLRVRCRTVEVSFAVDFPTALGINLRNSVELLDRRLPGGVAIGKVKKLTLTVADGIMIGKFTLGCAIGNDTVTVPAVGTGGYASSGYVSAGYQVIAGAQSLLGTGDIAYETFGDFVVVDDGLDLTNLGADVAVNECIVSNGLTKQMAGLQPYQNAVLPAAGLSDPNQTFTTLKTTVTLDMKPVTGAEFHTDFTPSVSQLSLPKLVDLSAATPGG